MKFIRAHALASTSTIVLACFLSAGCTVSPVELQRSDLGAVAHRSLETLDAGQEPIGGPVDLYEAIARAVKYNLDHRVELAEQSVRERELVLSHYSLLPNLVASSGYAARDEVNASNSKNAFTGQQSLATSTSQDQRLRTADIAFGWNVLDFGLSYVRARQASDKVLVQQELRRKVRLKITEEVRSAYWRALSAQRLLGELARVEAMAHAVERDSRTLAAQRETSAITALTYQREIVDVQRVIGEVQRELNAAHAQLAALMNVRPGMRFTLAHMPRSTIAAPGGSAAELIHIALTNRPELREVEYRKRINEHEAHAALLELLPGLNLIAGANFDSNSFLLHDEWKNWGARASWNLLKVFAYPARREVVEEQGRMLETRTLAVAMAIMTQVHVSHIRYAHARKEYDTARRYRDVQVKLLAQIRAEASADRVARQTQVREELNAVVAEAKFDIAFATMAAALANIHTSLGNDPYDGRVVEQISVREVAAAVRSADAQLVRLAAASSGGR